jgi:hypothetical protein
LSTWENYPNNYRESEIQAILKAVKAGECVSVIGLSGAGKSNLLGFLANRVNAGVKFAAVDCNDLPGADSVALLKACVEAISATINEPPTLSLLNSLVKEQLTDYPGGVCFLLDRFDLFNSPTPENAHVAGNLRALRDRFKYRLTYITSTRVPLDPNSELAELFYAHTFWLGTLSRADALWSIGEYVKRGQLGWSETECEDVRALSGGYPSLLRAVCEAHAAGAPLELSALRECVAVKRRMDEFWRDEPSSEALKESRLADIPLLQARDAPGEFTAAEKRLFDHLQQHEGEVCGKDELIQAVWPEETLVNGLRDDSLTQLVHRLREKIDIDGREHIQTVTGRGYRYKG